MKDKVICVYRRKLREKNDKFYDFNSQIKK